MNEHIVEKVMLGGSKRIGRLPDQVVELLESFMKEGVHFVCGDAQGTDYAFQVFLQSRGYKNVSIYCSGEKCRFNLCKDDWKEVHIDVPSGVEGYDFYRLKDLKMIRTCDLGLMVWDRASIGTRNNIYDLKALGKPVFAFNVDKNQLKISRRKEATK